MDFLADRPTSAISNEPGISRDSGQGRVSVLNKAHNRLQSAVEVAEDKLKILYERLQPVLTPNRPPQPENGAKEAAQSAALTDHINSMSARVDRIASGIEEILMRLEL